MPLTVVTIDYETYWSQTYTLSKLTPIEYVMGPEFEVQSCATKINEEETIITFGHDETAKLHSTIDWDNTLLVAHNGSEFDFLISSQHFNINPKLYCCTLAMARPIHAKTVGGSLKALAEHYGLQAKGSLEATNTKGLHLSDFTPEMRRAMAEYNTLDVDITYELFKILAKQTPRDEMRLIDLTIRMLVEPRFECDLGLLRRGLTAERKRKDRLLVSLSDRLGIEHDAEQVRKTCASAAKFKDLLNSIGVEVPTKTSPTTGKEIPALAKTDPAMTALLEHPDETVQAAAEARLGVRSTILETRIQRFIDAAEAFEGKMPIPLRYYGADTTGRWGGTMSLNCFGGDTEVLTPTGWVRFDRWDGRPIMQWWPNGVLSFDDGPGYLCKPYSGNVVSIDSRFVSGMFTPEHRLVSTPQTKSGIRERTAQWVAEHSGLDNIPVGGVWVGAIESRYSPDEARLMVAIAADSTVEQSGRFAIGLRKSRKIERMRYLLSRCAVNYTERAYRAQAGHSSLNPTVHFYFHDNRFSKGWGAWVLQLSREALDAAVDEIPMWDGWRNNNGGRTDFGSADRDDTLWVSTAVHLSGLGARVRTYSRSRQRPFHQIHVRASNLTSISTTDDVKVEKFCGDVYCASVESSYILVRHQDRIFVCGQCQNLPRVGKKAQISDVLRKSLRAPKGHKVVVADLSGIELRVNHFLWKEPDSVRRYQADRQADLYRAFAAMLFSKPEEEVTKDERQLGKVCLAEGTQVLTDRGLVPIERVTTLHKLWDGVEWVSHDGVVCNGEREVITYDGLTATPDHEVFTRCGRKVPLWKAEREALRLARTGDGRAPVGVLDAIAPGVSPNFSGGQGSVLRMPEVRDQEVGELRQPARTEDDSMPAMRATVRSPNVVAPTAGIGEAEMHQPERPGVQSIRGSGGRVSLSVASGGGCMDYGEPGAGEGQGNRPDQQPRALRTGKSPMGNAPTERGEPAPEPLESVSSVSSAAPGGSVRGQHAATHAWSGDDSTRDSGQVPPTLGQTKRRVWDILNAGPRHRFTASDRLVSNCQLGLGYGVGWSKFKDVARLMGGIELSDDEAKRVTDTWRNTYRNIVQGWKTCNQALSVIYGGSGMFAIDPWELCVATAQGIKTPRGAIRYPDLRLEGEGNWIYGHGRSKARIYGPKITENLVQHLSRHVMTDAMLAYLGDSISKHAPIVHTVHDEVICVAPDAIAQEALDTLQDKLRTPPTWWPELVLYSDGSYAQTYGDAKS